MPCAEGAQFDFGAKNEPKPRGECEDRVKFVTAADVG
jgi:hypothetical protein